LKIRHVAIVDNVVTHVYAKFGDDRLWNEKALADRKSDNNNTNTKKNKKNKKNVGGAWRPVSGSTKYYNSKELIFGAPSRPIYLC